MVSLKCYNVYLKRLKLLKDDLSVESVYDFLKLLTILAVSNIFF